ncbi:hypothetical protein NDU88_002545 [Pleurodeles waltl]|uniref:Uncharacterized protein n=1 Tax=Pleurodeles waltl TaxID=8319 RepID=A0AAV7LEH2_PLEWA|nr:hypothetical protein NDU88_002545 [Pleurodeles waltl]
MPQYANIYFADQPLGRDISPCYCVPRNVCIQYGGRLVVTNDEAWVLLPNAAQCSFTQLVDSPDRYAALLATAPKERCKNNWLEPLWQVQQNSDVPVERLAWGGNGRACSRPEEPGCACGEVSNMIVAWWLVPELSRAVSANCSSGWA